MKYKQRKAKIIPKQEEKELLKGRKGLVFCKDCNAVYYKKSWHHNLRNYKNLKEDLSVSFAVCPACRMIENGKFEGQIFVEGAPNNSIESVVHLAEAFCHRAYLKDPMDRIIKIKKRNSGIDIFTTENQLAIKLAKKIKDVFKKVDLNISYASSPTNAVYITAQFR